MEGFFTKEEAQPIGYTKGKPASCARCGLHRHVHTPKMKPFGNMAKGILNIGEAPGEVEDRKGQQWQGTTGKLLERTYKKIGIDLFEDCLNINAVNCRPISENGTNRTPKASEIGCCRKRVFQVIEQYEPKMIVLLGGAALSSVIGHLWKDKLGGITRWRGWQIPERELRAWVCPTFHPSFVQRSNDNKAAKAIWERDLKMTFRTNHKAANVLSHTARLASTGGPNLSMMFPAPNHERQYVEIIDDLSPLRNIKSTLSSFDYEATGLKPHAKGHRIVCASVATGPDHAYAFMMPKTRKKREPFIEYLENRRIAKIAANMKFEDTWTVVRLRTQVAKWGWDTMQAAHVLDNRAGITGLKFQTYVNFGVADYASEVTPFLKSKEEKNGNAFNRIMELIEHPGGKEKLLMYCGLDSIFEYRLAIKQMDIMKAELIESQS